MKRIQRLSERTARTLALFAVFSLVGFHLGSAK